MKQCEICKGYTDDEQPCYKCLAKQIAACLGFSDQWVRNHASRNKIRLMGRSQKHSRITPGNGDAQIKAIAAQEGRDNTCVVRQATPEELAEFAHITALKKAEYVEYGDGKLMRNTFHGEARQSM